MTEIRGSDSFLFDDENNFHRLSESEEEEGEHDLRAEADLGKFQGFAQDDEKNQWLLLQRDPLYEFLEIYCGVRRLESVKEVLIPSYDEMSIASGLRVTKRTYQDKERIDEEIWLPVDTREGQKKNDAARFSQNVLKPQVAADMNQALQEVERYHRILSGGPLPEKYRIAKDYAESNDRILKNEFAVLAGWIGLRTEFFKPSRSTYQRNLDDIEKNMKLHAKRLAEYVFGMGK